MSKILYEDYPQLNITEKTIENIKKHPALYQNVSPKVALGKIYTNEQFENKSEQILIAPLPGPILKRKR